MSPIQNELAKPATSSPTSSAPHTCGPGRGEVAGVLDRGTGGDPDGSLQLGRDDEGERGLAEARRTGQQDVVGHAPPTAGGLEDERELVAHPGLAGELREPLGTQRRLDDPLEVGVGDVGVARNIEPARAGP